MRQVLQRNVQHRTLPLPVKEQGEGMEVTNGKDSRVSNRNISRGHPTIPARGSRRDRVDEIDQDDPPKD